MIGATCKGELESHCENAVSGILTDLEGLDGCGMVITLEGGDRIEPRNLGAFVADPEDGAKLWITYQSVPAAMSVCMIGTIVDITCLEKR